MTTSPLVSTRTMIIKLLNNWRTVTTRDFFIFKKITFDLCLMDYPIFQLCLINEHESDDFDRELVMLSLAVKEITTCNRAIIIARFATHRRDIFIVRLNQPRPLSATLHPVPDIWSDLVAQKYELLDRKEKGGKNHF